jgi:hypothetical protein
MNVTCYSSATYIKLFPNSPCLSTQSHYDNNIKVGIKMGMFRDSSSPEIDIIKEMAEGLGSTGLRLEDLIEKGMAARQEALEAIEQYYKHERDADRTEISLANDLIRQYNGLVEQAEDALRWLLIQREACGFRTHRNVDRFYPIPAKMKLIKK